MIGSISGKFSPPPCPATVVEPIDSEPPKEPCPTCGSEDWWQAASDDRWRCRSCEKPPSVSLVARSCFTGRRVLSRSWATCCVPWCPRCRCWRAVESTWSDDTVETRCEHCDELLPDWPDPSLLADHDAGLRAKFKRKSK